MVSELSESSQVADTLSKNGGYQEMLFLYSKIVYFMNIIVESFKNKLLF